MKNESSKVGQNTLMTTEVRAIVSVVGPITSGNDDSYSILYNILIKKQ